MKSHALAAQRLISQIPAASWRAELEKASSRFHLMACWVAIIFDPIFAITDYINIPENWELLLIIRLTVSSLILVTVIMQKRYNLSTYKVVTVPFVLISLQNAVTYIFIGNEDLLGHNLNYMALFVGASMFVLWRWSYSVIIILMSAVATAFFLRTNPAIEIHEFFLNGGLLLITIGIFMIVLIQTRYNLTVKEIRARLALQISNEEIQTQAEEIEVINENLEAQVQNRTMELQRKNRALEEYAFINAHKLRSPLASILGLINLMSNVELNHEGKSIMKHMSESARNLDSIVASITKAIEDGTIEEKNNNGVSDL